MKGVMLSTDLNNPETIPYFLWDDPITVGELKHHLKQGTQAESNRLLAKILREAKDSDVWIFTTPIEVTQRWGAIAHMLESFGNLYSGIGRKQVCLSNKITLTTLQIDFLFAFFNKERLVKIAYPEK